VEIYRQFLYRVPILSSALPLLETIDDALQTHGVTYEKLLFHLSDSPYAKTSACDRVVKKFPTLHSCLLNYTDSSKDQIRALTNFGPDWKFGHSTSPVIDNSLTILKEVAAGIPRPFPFHHATFIFDSVQWWQGSQPTTRAKTNA
jgi:hypothetical protein